MTYLLLSEGVEKQFVTGISVAVTMTYLLLSEGVENSLLLGSLWQSR